MFDESISITTANSLYDALLPGDMESVRLQCTPEGHAIAERISMMCSNQCVDIS